MYIYIYIYINIVIHIYICIYRYIDTYIFGFAFICVSKKTYIYIYVFIYIYHVFCHDIVFLFFFFLIVGRRNDAYLQWCCVVMDYAWQTSGFLLISRAWRCHVDHLLDRQVVMRSQKLPVRLYTVLIGYAAMIGVDAKVDLRMIEFLFLCRTSSVPR